MKILCSLSGLEFTCDHFPGTFCSKETYHPIFNLSQHRLLSYAGKWAAHELTDTDSYLLFLAILKSTDRVEFRSPVFRTEMTNSIVAQNMEHLMKITTKMNTIVHPSAIFPTYVISPDTRALSNVRYWLDNWYSCYAEFQSGKIKDWDNRKLVQRENALERLIKNKHKTLKEKAGQIADWAAVAGEFPSGMTPSPWKANTQISLDDYWKELIIKAASDFGLLGATKQVLEDYHEMMEHCYCKIAKGTIFSHELFSILRGALDRQKNFLGFDVDLSKPKFVFADVVSKVPSQDVELTNLRVLIGKAPDHEPTIAEYNGSKFAYLKAKVAWEYAQKAAREEELMQHRRKDDPAPGQEPGEFDPDELGELEPEAETDHDGADVDDNQSDAPSDSESNDESGRDDESDIITAEDL